MAAVLNLNDVTLYDNFGKVSYSSINNSFTHFIANELQNDNRFESFKQISKNILTNNDDYNAVFFHNLVFNLSNQNPALVDSIIVKLFDETTQNIHNEIANKIVNNTFTVKYFIDIYPHFLFLIKKVNLKNYQI